MTQNSFNGLPPRVVTYIKIHLRYIFSTGLFSYQEREDLIQDLVLFYLERFYRKKEVPDDYLFVSLSFLSVTTPVMLNCWAYRNVQLQSNIKNRIEIFFMLLCFLIRH